MDEGQRERERCEKKKKNEKKNECIICLSREKGSCTERLRCFALPN